MKCDGCGEENLHSKIVILILSFLATSTKTLAYLHSKIVILIQDHLVKPG